MTPLDEPADPPPIPWRWIFVGTTLAGVLSALRMFVSYRAFGTRLSAQDALVSGWMEWWLWILFIPLVIRLADRFELFGHAGSAVRHRGSARTIRRAALHAALAFGVSFAHLISFSALSGVVRHFRFGDRFRVDLMSPLSVLFVPGVLVYVAVVAARWWTSSRQRYVATAASTRELRERLEESRADRPAERVAFSSGRGTLHLVPDEIDWVRGAGNYLELHTGSGMHLVRETLKRAHERLGVERFVRIHRSTLVRAGAVVGVSDGARPEAILAGGERLAIGASFRDAAYPSLALDR